jgi:DNA-binding CsgD family transcriptional regulator
VHGSEPSVELTARTDLGTLLTAQERACLRLVAQRLSSKEIAARLGIAKTSVDTYCNRARRKLGVSDRYAAARLLAAGCEPGAPATTVVTAAPSPARRPSLALVGGGLVAAALGLGALLAGMSALESLKPPDWDERVARAAAKASLATP